MKKTFLLALVLLGSLLFSLKPHFMFDPAISPDGNKVCFVYQNDLWLVSFDGGVAKRLTSTEFNEFGPVFSPDGKYIAYASNRNHIYQTWYMPITGGTAKLFNPENATPFAFFSNSKSILSSMYQIGEGSSFIKLPKGNKRFEHITGLGESLSDISPDDSKILFSRKGNAHREKYKGSTNGELWEYNIKTKNYKRLTNTNFTERYPVYSHTVKNRIYFGASDGKVFQLYYADNYDFKNRKKLTNFDTWSVRDISIAEDNDKMVFECFDNLYSYNPKTKKAKKINIEIQEDLIKNFDVVKEVKSKADYFAISENGLWAAFSYKYDLFAVPVKGGEVKQITFDAQGIDDITIMPDNKTVYFSKFEKGKCKLYTFNIKNTKKVKKVSWFDDKSIDVNYHYTSNDSLLYVSYRDGEKFNRLAQFKQGSFKKILPNTKIYNFSVNNAKTKAVYNNYNNETYATNVYLYDFKTKKSTLIHQTDKTATNFAWSKDDKTLFFTVRDGIAKLNLVPVSDYENEEDNWKDILASKKDKKDKKSKKENKKEIINNPKKLDSIDTRFSKIIGKSGWCWIIAVNKDDFYYIHSASSNKTLYKYNIKKEKNEKLASLGNAKHISYNKGLKKITYLNGNTIYTSSISGSGKKSIDYSFTYNFNKQQLIQTVFEQIWGYFGKGFYDKKMHGVNWEDVYKLYKPYTKYAYTNSLLETIIDEMIGDVNASHTGFYPNSDSYYKHYSTAYTGMVFDFSKKLSKGLKIKKVFRDTKLAQAFDIKKGDILLKVDGKEINKNTSFKKLFVNKVGKKINLTIKSDGKEKNVQIKGVGYTTANDWRYNNWVYERKQRVEKLSKGKIGYLHIRGMNQKCLKKFKKDLWAVNYNKKALIIDIRGNGGGNISEELMEELTKVKMATTTRRNGEPVIKNYPANVASMPKVVMINENSFSDAEIFPYLFRSQNLGKLVGMPTSGGVIGTSPRNLIDGSSMRMPSSGWYRLNGKNMELNGTVPDILVEMTPKQILQDDDVQLKAAVDELLKQIK